MAGIRIISASENEIVVEAPIGLSESSSRIRIVQWARRHTNVENLSENVSELTYEDKEFHPSAGMIGSYRATIELEED